VVDDFGTGVRFVATVSEAGDALGHHPRGGPWRRYIDLRLVTDDAVYRDDDGSEHVVEWVTSGISTSRSGSPRSPRNRRSSRPGLDHHDRTRPRHGARRDDRPGVGGPADREHRGPGRGTIGDDVRDATGRVPILWFQDTDEHETPRQRFHVDVWVPPEVAEQRIAAARRRGRDRRRRQPGPSYT
jgi:4a-hydroxytetrahydrobiopterin dehydratase